MVLCTVPIHHKHHLQAREGDSPDTAQALPQVIWVLLVGGNAESHGASQVLWPGGASHPPMLQEGEKALEQEMKGKEGTIEAKG